MYIVEAPHPPSTPDDPAFELAGTDEERDQFRGAMSSLILTVLDSDDALIEIGAQVLAQTWSNTIRQGDSAVFAQALRYATDLQEEDNEQHGLALDYTQIRYVTKEGLDAELSSGGILEPHVLWIGTPEVEWGHNSRLAALSRRLGATSFAYQHELDYDPDGTPHIHSNRQHLSLGRTDPDGQYTPILTDLVSSHPLRTPLDEATIRKYAYPRTDIRLSV